MLIPFRFTDLVSTTKGLTFSSQTFSVYLLIVANLTIFAWQLLAQHIYDFSLIKLGAVVPFDFLAASEYSKWDAEGYAPVRVMRNTPIALHELLEDPHLLT